MNPYADDQPARTYVTRNEAIEREIVVPITNGDALASEFDIEAIADEVLTLDARGRYVLATDVDAFWETVERHFLVGREEG